MTSMAQRPSRLASSAGLSRRPRQSNTASTSTLGYGGSETGLLTSSSSMSKPRRVTDNVNDHGIRRETYNNVIDPTKCDLALKLAHADSMILDQSKLIGTRAFKDKIISTVRALHAERNIHSTISQNVSLLNKKHTSYRKLRRTFNDAKSENIELRRRIAAQWGSSTKPKDTVTVADPNKSSSQYGFNPTERISQAQQGTISEANIKDQIQNKILSQTSLHQVNPNKTNQIDFQSATHRYDSIEQPSNQQTIQEINMSEQAGLGFTNVADSSLSLGLNQNSSEVCFAAQPIFASTVYTHQSAPEISAQDQVVKVIPDSWIIRNSNCPNQDLTIQTQDQNSSQTQSQSPLNSGLTKGGTIEEIASQLLEGLQNHVSVRSSTSSSASRKLRKSGSTANGSTANSSTSTEFTGNLQQDPNSTDSSEISGGIASGVLSHADLAKVIEFRSQILYDFQKSKVMGKLRRASEVAKAQASNPYI